jgi:tetratricopeptide (TPR) repeat protein
VLGVGGLGGALVGLWSFGVTALSADRIPLHDRALGGHALGLLVVAMVIALLVAGLGVGFALAESAPSLGSRRIAGAVVLVCVALVPIAFAGLLATSDKGLGGSISSAWHDLTDPNATVPSNDPDRLTAIGSVRARYWDEALKIWRANEAVGAGAGNYRTARLRYRVDQLNVRHAHGYVVQTMADLGLVGLGVTLALLAAWLAAAGRTAGLWGPGRRAGHTPERIGMLTLATIVLVFGVHSFVDWTWIVPGNAVPALLCAGWLAGRGPLVEPAGRERAWRESLRSVTRSPASIAGIVAVLALTAVAVWTTWQPQRSVRATDAALESVEANRLPAARADVRRARDADPLSTTPLYVGATVELAARNVPGARRLYQEAVHMQPSSSETWLRLAQFELAQGDAKAALRAVGPALFLDPRSPIVQQTYFDASRSESARRSAAAASKQRAKPRGGG